tara:strand:+ start:152 stop:298 length:147 start_codon:yes stop_codon:yes gene_type:complete
LTELEIIEEDFKVFSSVVAQPAERLAVNQDVVGSSPTYGAKYAFYTKG